MKSAEPVAAEVFAFGAYGKGLKAPCLNARLFGTPLSP
jgi:hypothetical protein